MSNFFTGSAAVLAALLAAPFGVSILSRLPWTLYACRLLPFGLAGLLSPSGVVVMLLALAALAFAGARYGSATLLRRRARAPGIRAPGAAVSPASIHRSGSSGASGGRIHLTRTSKRRTSLVSLMPASVAVGPAAFLRSLFATPARASTSLEWSAADSVGGSGSSPGENGSGSGQSAGICPRKQPLLSEGDIAIFPWLLRFRSDDTEATYVASCFRLHGDASWNQFALDAVACIALIIGFALNAPAEALLLWRPGFAAIGGVLFVTFMRQLLLSHLLAEIDNASASNAPTELTLPVAQWSLIVKSFSYFILMTTVSSWAAALGQLHQASAALILAALCKIGINVISFEVFYAAALLSSGLLMHVTILAHSLWTTPLDKPVRPRWLEVLVVVPLLIVLILIQSFVSRWSHAQSTRRDFVLQMLARHRRNMSRYLVRLVAHMWAVSF